MCVTRTHLCHLADAPRARSVP